AREMNHDQRGVCFEFDCEIAVRDGVDRVLAELFEAELARDVLAVDRIARAGEGGAAERQSIDAATAINESFDIAREHRIVGHQMMTECHRLRDLQMREARHYRVRMRLSEVDQCAPQCNKLPNQCVDRTAQPQSQIGGDLIVARACRVQSLSRVTDERDQTPLDIEVNILELACKLKFTAL